MKIIDGTNVVLGRLASYVAKEVLKGEEIIVVNCNEVIITGNKKDIERNFKEKRSRVGSSQKGPKHHKVSEKIVKRVIRGMLPSPREGRGKQALGRVKCYNKIPKEFEGKEFFKFETGKKSKFSKVKEFLR
ncbi:MAG: 50S ribosomal protein L13 [Candidatus Pacearchaeota archaeon]|nr:50S ribosomal protein L13 [Candidatus Pacearchaeota archaeon]